MDLRHAVLLLLVVQLASAAELKLHGELHYNSLSVTLQNTVDHTIHFTLKFQLKQKTTEWKLLQVLNCSVNGSIGPLDSKEFNCSYTTPAEQGEYKIYARADIINGTYTYKDFLLGTGVSSAKSGDVTIRLVSAPENVKTGDEFDVIVNVTSGRFAELEIYSYVYSGQTCYSFYGWKGNSIKLGLKAGEAKTLNLTDVVVHDAVNGTYQLKVRAREAVGDKFKDHDVARAIEVEQVPIDLFKELPKTADSKTHSQGTGLPLQLLFPLLGSIPLLAIIIKKVL